MITSILPADVAAAELIGAELAEPLFAAEAATIRAASAERQREFVSVRGCARRAFAHFGLPRPPLVPGPDGASTWPAGLTGSMTHCVGYRGSAVARSSEYAAIGIDAEPHAHLPAGILDRVSCQKERAQVAELPGGVCWDRVLFSAKECVTKAVFSMLGRPIGFRGSEIHLDPAGHFTVAFAGPEAHDIAGLGVVRGRWAVEDGLVVTAVATPHLPALSRAVAGPVACSQQDTLKPRATRIQDYRCLRGLRLSGETKGQIGAAGRYSPVQPIAGVRPGATLGWLRVLPRTQDFAGPAAVEITF